MQHIDLTARRPARRRAGARRTLAAVATAALTGVTLAAAACAPAGGAPPSEFAGIVLPEPLAKPAVTLTDTQGQPYDLRRETDGKVTLLFFGYTSCPDVCPVHMANIAAVLKAAEPEVRDNVKVVFVTTDPERDTPQRLREWLDSFDPSFVGLTAPLDEVNRIQATLNIPPAVRQPLPPGADSAAGYGVGHAAQVIAFSPFDDLAHVVYPFGTRQRDWAHDLPELVEHRW
ncbi:MAG TPA: SCO family protein [Gemmatimonadaceae bacterium]|nr:SCO family protein [Gemmatimonadaceae bacterium]